MKAKVATVFSLAGLIITAIAVILAAVPAYAATPSSAYVAVTPTRVLDTRTSGGPLGAGSTRTLVVAGAGTTVPAAATGVVLNVTATNTTAQSFITVWATGSAQPLASNLNPVAGKTVPNLVETPVGTGGSISFFNAAGSTDLVADLEGYFIAPSNTAGAEVALTPARITDTRAGSGLPNAGNTLGTGGTITVQVTGAGGVPGTGVSGVVLNVTATNTGASSFFTVWPTGQSQPLASNLNWTAGVTVPNRVFVPVGTGGKVSIFNAVGAADAVVDVSGYFTDNTVASGTGQYFNPQNPNRVLDTRNLGGPLGAGGTRSLMLAGAGATLPAGSKAAILNVTVTNTTAPSFLNVYPSSAARPLSSDLNWVANQTIPNLTAASIDSTGSITFFNAAGSTDVVADIFGYWGPAPAAAGTTVTATPASVAADGATQSSVVATVTNSTGGAVSGDAVSFSKSASVTGSCGTLNASTGVTNSLGQVTITYTASTTVGSCTITATEANSGSAGSAVITQVTPPNSISVAPAGPTNKAADGASTQTFTATVLDPNGVAVSGDNVNWTASGTCGTVNPASTTTNSSGNATSVYITSSTSGFCKVTATETGTAQSASGWITQTSSPAPASTPYHLTNVACTATVPADKSTTTSCTTTVTNNVAALINGDPVLFTKSGANCKDVQLNGGSSAITSTNSLGQASFTYTAGSVAGNCTLNAYESNAGASNTAGFETQTAVPNTVTVTATPSTIPNNGTSSSTVVATVTSPGGAAVSGDSVTFAGAATPGGACGTGIPAGALVTNSSGQVAFGYVSSTTAGFCKITASDNGTGTPLNAGTVGSGSATVTQTSTSGNTITATASATSVPADNATQSTITATVKNSAGTGVSGDIVSFSKSASVAGACGALTSASAGTNANGVVTNTYTASATAGTCTITITESNGGASTTVAITQTTPPNKVTVTPNPTTAAANGSTAVTFTANVTTFGGISIVGDTVSFTVSGSPSAACGTMNPASAATNSSGNATSVYISSSTSGWCTITGADNGTGTPAGPAGSGTAVVDQTTSPVPANVNYNVAAVTCTATVPADKSTTTTCKTTVTDSTAAAVSGDAVRFSKGAGCTDVQLNGGSSTVVTTNSLGQASFTYRAGSVAGACTINAAEASDGQSNNTGTEVQTPVPDTVSASASPSSITANGTSTSTITILVNDANGVPVNAQVVNLVGTPTPGGACGSFPANATTNSSGQATVVYVSSTTAGFCNITITEALPKSASTTVQITQHP